MGGFEPPSENDCFYASTVRRLPFDLNWWCKK